MAIKDIRVAYLGALNSGLANEHTVCRSADRLATYYDDLPNLLFHSLFFMCLTFMYLMGTHNKLAQAPWPTKSKPV